MIQRGFMYSKIISDLLVLDKSQFVRYDAVNELLIVANDTHEMTVSPTIFTLSSVTYTNNVMDRAKSLPLTKDQLVIIHHEMFLHQTNWAECCEVTRQELETVIEYYRTFG